MSQQQNLSKILLVGDSCYDYYHYGRVNRISPEAPIPIFDFEYVTKKRGMTSNVYDNLKALGADVHIITAFFENKRRYIDLKTGQQLLRVDEKINAETYENVEGKLFDDYDTLVISDYDKGFLTYEDIEGLIKKFKFKNVFIDTKKRDLARFSGSTAHTHIKINEHEYSKAISSHESLIVTHGSEKIVWNGIHGVSKYQPPKVDIHDVCGAGDTFLAALAYSYKGDNMEEAIQFAMKAAAITVQKIGVYAPTLEEINN